MPQVGGHLGGVFDEDPKRWRLTAEIFKTLGLAAEIATPFFPGSFVALVRALVQPAWLKLQPWGACVRLHLLNNSPIIAS